MGNLIVVLVGVGGGLACLSLAYWVWKRANSATGSGDGDDPQDKYGTVVIAKADLFGERAAEPKTEFIPREELLRAADREQQAPSRTPEPQGAATEFIPHAEMQAMINANRRKPPGD